MRVQAGGLVPFAERVSAVEAASDLHAARGYGRCRFECFAHADTLGADRPLPGHPSG